MCDIKGTKTNQDIEYSAKTDQKLNNTLTSYAVASWDMSEWPEGILGLSANLLKVMEFSAPLGNRISGSNVF